MVVTTEDVADKDSDLAFIYISTKRNSWMRCKKNHKIDPRLSSGGPVTRLNKGAND